MDSVVGDEEFRANRIGVLPPELILQYSGLEVLQRLANGELPVPAMSVTIQFGLTLTEVAAGRVAFESTPTERFYHTAGTVHGGHALACFAGISILERRRSRL